MKNANIFINTFINTFISLALFIIMLCQLKALFTSNEYEYRVQFMPDSVSSIILEKVASEKWYIINARRCANSNNEVGYELIMKRGTK